MNSFVKKKLPWEDYDSSLLMKVTNWKKKKASLIK